MDNIGNCKLCDKEDILQNSHIIPSSIIKSVKKGDSQLYTLSRCSSLRYENADPKEYLLCRSCEQLLNRRYEKYGLELLKKSSNVTKHSNCIEFKKFKYQKWYLYYLSIIWRASISSLSDFQQVNLSNLNDVLKQCIKKNTLRVSSEIDIDEFIKITMFRVTDKSHRLDELTIRNILMNLTHVPVQESNEHLFFFMSSGFLVQFRLTPFYIQLKDKTPFTRADMARNNQRFVRYLDITESKFLTKEFNWLIDNV
ncbi:hypothetical protein CRN32_03920 [Vibrio vulnificus]|uniref:hypothetical protein n=1 Tax=Vibrio TaxID=662 RepID=UPI0006A6592A|nr:MULTISPECIES: hypothetical protein [Vibrio]EHR0248245.1 hypothetical protein [Vibrio parahaemolyticus]EHR7166267.1 hypothetical protein [Vibrio parahaemolyticus]EJC6737770.1 hypothetical protein [Vibrio vulnificus]EJT1341304.1 hypothetical protein [Vibrio vulnificus]ELG5191675.1 hypothetical protein [Vibrio vulnificus]